MLEPTHDTDLTDLEAALRTLQPRADLDRAALWFRAGQAAARGRWAWPLAALVSSAAAAVLGCLLLTRPAPPTVERVVFVPIPVPAPVPPEIPSPPPEAQTPLAAAVPEVPDWGLSPPAVRLRDHVLRWGLDGLPLPAEPTPSPPPETPASLLRLQ